MKLEGTMKSAISSLIWSTIWLSIVPAGFGGHILILCPYFAKSIYGFHVAIARSLHAAGHQITIVHPFSKDTACKNFTVIDCSLPDQPKKSNWVHTDEALRKTEVLDMLLLTRDESERDCYNTIQLEEIQKILHSTKNQFDTLIVDLIQPMHECFLPIAEILEIPVIGTCAAKNWWRTDRLIGNPNNPAEIPTELSFWSSRMNFRQQLTNSWYWTVNYLFENLFVHPRLELFTKKHFPSSSVAQRIKPSLIFANSHQMFITRPFVPNVINVGGIHVQSQPAKLLPQNFQKFIDGAKDGVILFTFGSMIRMFDHSSPELDIFKSAFAQIPQRVIWKMENEIEDLPQNVMTSKWLPQRDILAHHNVVAFITHCGLSGIFEAIYEAKPLIMMPIFFDQMSNAAIFKDLGVGVSLDIKALTVEKVLKAINNIVQDTKYRTQMQNISKIVKDAPMTPSEAVVYWTEYVIRHKGAPHLRTVAADMPLVKYLLLDVILFLSGVVSVFVYFSFWCCKKKSASKKQCRIPKKQNKIVS